MPWLLRLARVDLRALAVARILLGMALLYDWIERVRDFGALSSDAGVLPLDAHPLAGTVRGALAPALWSASDAWQGALLGAAGLAYLALAVGWRARWSTVASWVLLCAVRDRNPFVGYGFDTVATLTLASLAFLPVGARYSVDARQLQSPSSSVASPAVLVLLAHACLVYGITALMKLQHAPWRNGSAIALTLGSDQTATWLGKAVLAVPHASGALTAIVLAFEIAIPVLLTAPRTRPIGVAVVVALQVGINLTMHIGVFGLASVAMVLPFALPAQEPVDVRAPRWLWGLSALAVASAGVWNACWLGVPKHDRLPRAYTEAVRVLHLDQNWGMFSSNLEHRTSRRWTVDGEPPPLDGLHWLYWMNVIGTDGPPDGLKRRRADTARVLGALAIVQHDVDVLPDGSAGAARDTLLPQ